MEKCLNVVSPMLFPSDLHMGQFLQDSYNRNCLYYVYCICCGKELCKKSILSTIQKKEWLQDGISSDLDNT